MRKLPADVDGLGIEQQLAARALGEVRANLQAASCRAILARAAYLTRGAGRSGASFIRISSRKAAYLGLIPFKDES
jgi:hypothetical protein